MLQPLEARVSPSCGLLGLLRCLHPDEFEFGKMFHHQFPAILDHLDQSIPLSFLLSRRPLFNQMGNP